MPAGPDLNAQLHAAYDDRPLWRKVLGLDPDSNTMSPQLQNYLGQQKQAAQQQIASQLQGVDSGYKQGAIEGAKIAPFMVLGPAGELVSGAVGGGGLGTAPRSRPRARRLPHL